MNSIKKLNNHELVESFKDAVEDNHYSPYDKNYNESGFTMDELKAEIYSRLNGGINEEEEDEEW